MGLSGMNIQCGMGAKVGGKRVAAQPLTASDGRRMAWAER